MARKLDIDWPELQFAFDSSFGEACCYLDRETGTVVTLTEDIRASADDEDDAEGFDPELMEAVRAIDGGSEHYLPIPGQDGREGYRDMEEFIATVRDPRLAELLAVAIAGRGAFRRFKDVLAGSPGERERWFAWHDSRQHERILAWLASEGIDATSAPTAPEVPSPAESCVERAGDLLEELTLHCLYLGSWEEPTIGRTVHRAWTGFRFEILDALEARGLVAQTRRGKSLHLTEEGLQRAREPSWRGGFQSSRPGFAQRVAARPDGPQRPIHARRPRPPSAGMVAAPGPGEATCRSRSARARRITSG